MKCIKCNLCMQPCLISGLHGDIPAESFSSDIRVRRIPRRMKHQRDKREAVRSQQGATFQRRIRSFGKSNRHNWSWLSDQKPLSCPLCTPTTPPYIPFQGLWTIGGAWRITAYPILRAWWQPLAVAIGRQVSSQTL